MEWWSGGVVAGDSAEKGWRVRRGWIYHRDTEGTELELNREHRHYEVNREQNLAFGTR
jgi:hypothetical protein